MRILVSYVHRPYTTAIYYERAFERLGHLVCRTGLEMDHVALAWKPDLFVWIEAGGALHPAVLPTGMPTVAYYIDSHTQRGWHIEDARRYDHVFVSDSRYVGEYGPNAHWLPMACDPDLHTPTRTEPPEYDVAFVGNLYPGSPLYEDRRRTLAELAKRYRCNFQSGVYFTDMANVYASAKVVFNKSVMGDLNMRVFEAMCSGRPLVTDRVEGLQQLFGTYPADEPRRCVSYNGTEDLIGKLDALLTDRILWLGDYIGATGRAEVLAHHTYAHRAAQILAEVGP